MFSSWNTCNIKVCPLVSVEMESWPLCLGKPSNIQTIKLPHTRVTEASARVALQIVLAERSLCKLKATEIGGLFYHWQILRLWLDAVSYLCYVLTSNPHTFPLHTYIYFIHTFFSSNTHLMSTYGMSGHAGQWYIIIIIKKDTFPTFKEHNLLEETDKSM